MKKKKWIQFSLAGLVILPILVITGALGSLAVRSRILDDDYSDIFEDVRYEEALLVDGIEVIEQKHTCGYAVIEMVSFWNGGRITEDQMHAEHDRIVTATGKGFAEELANRLPDYQVVMHTGLANTELIQLVYKSLGQGKPVPLAWAAELEGEWTLHYSLVTSMNVPENEIAVANPYGYIEKVSIDRFLERTRYDAYEKMPLHIKLGFAFGIFEKNTVFTLE